MTEYRYRQVKDFAFTLRGALWTVRFLPMPANPEQYPHLSVGHCSPMLCEIHIIKDVPLAYMAQTLYHELFHAFTCHINPGEANAETLAGVVGDSLFEVVPQLPKWVLKKVPMERDQVAALAECSECSRYQPAVAPVTMKYGEVPWTVMWSSSEK